MNLVFEYMGIKPNWFCPQEVCEEEKKNCLNCPKVSIVTEFDGNLMVHAIQAMRERGEWDKFEMFAIAKLLADNTIKNLSYTSHTFGDPANFFKLFKEALEKKVIG